MAIDALAEWDHRGRVERGEVCEPAPHHEVDPGCKATEPRARDLCHADARDRQDGTDHSRAHQGDHDALTKHQKRD